MHVMAKSKLMSRVKTERKEAVTQQSKDNEGKKQSDEEESNTEY